jgi:hypothetical protein
MVGGKMAILTAQNSKFNTFLFAASTPAIIKPFSIISIHMLDLFQRLTLRPKSAETSCHETNL